MQSQYLRFLRLNLFLRIFMKVINIISPNFLCNLGGNIPNDTVQTSICSIIGNLRGYIMPSKQMEIKPVPYNCLRSEFHNSPSFGIYSAPFYGFSCKKRAPHYQYLSLCLSAKKGGTRWDRRMIVRLRQ
jgi:hypothetical protein